MPGARRIDSAHAVARGPAAQAILGGDAAARARRLRAARPRFGNARAGAIAVHARRRDVDEVPRYNPRARQRRQQMARARVVAAVGGRRREMQHRERRGAQAVERARDRRGRRRSARCHARAASRTSSRSRVRPIEPRAMAQAAARRAARRRRSRSATPVHHPAGCACRRSSASVAHAIRAGTHT